MEGMRRLRGRIVGSASVLGMGSGRGTARSNDGTISAGVVQLMEVVTEFSVEGEETTTKEMRIKFNRMEQQMKVVETIESISMMKILEKLLWNRLP